MLDNRHFLIRTLHPIFVTLVYIFLYVPIVILVAFSFNKSAFSGSWHGFTFDWYLTLIHNREMLDALQTSLIVAVSATFLSVVMGAALVFASRWWRSRWQFDMFRVNILFPEILLAVGMLTLFSFLQVPLGYTSIIAGHTLIGLGFVVPIIRARFSEIDPILIEASADLGASNAQTFRKIVMPLIMPSVMVSCLLVFTLSLDDFLLAFFCSGSGVQTLSVYVYSLVREGVSPALNAISTVLLVLSSFLIWIMYRFNIVRQLINHE